MTTTFIRRNITIALALVMSALAGIIIIRLGHHDALWWILACNGIVCLTPLLRAATVHKWVDPFDPALLFSVGFAVLFVIRPALDLYRHGEPPWIVGEDPSPTYARALLLSLIGAICFYLAYYSSTARRIGSSIPTPSPTWHGSNVRTTSAAIVLLSSILYLALLVRVGSIPAFLAYLSGRTTARSEVIANNSGYLYTAPFWLLGTGLTLIASSSKWNSLQAVAGVSLILLSQAPNIGAGNRSHMLPATISIVVLYYLKSGKRPSKRLWLLAIPAFFTFGLLLPRAVRTQAFTLATVLRAARDILLHPGTQMAEFFEGSDTAMLSNLALLVREVPHTLNYAYGLTYLEALTRAVPRSLWEGKPTEGDLLIMAAIWPDLRAAGTTFTFSIFGEPYYNFGFFGVAAVLASFGIGYGGLFHWLLLHSENSKVQLIFAACLPYVIVYLRGGIGVDYQRQLITLTPIAVALFISGFASGTSKDGPDTRQNPNA